MLAACVTLTFAARTVVFAVYWSDPAHHEQPLAGWMTPRYIARSWHVPPQVVPQALGLAPAQGHPEPLEKLARDAGIALPEAIARVKAAIAKTQTRMDGAAKP